LESLGGYYSLYSSNAEKLFTQRNCKGVIFPWPLLSRGLAPLPNRYAGKGSSQIQYTIQFSACQENHGKHAALWFSDICTQGFIKGAFQ